VANAAVVARARPKGARRSTAKRWLLPVLVTLFFLSGVSGLIYQVLWLRLLALVFGVTIYAASTVLASFMGGLALGSFLAGRFADRTHRPLRWFGFAEVLVGLSALASPVVLAGVERLYIAAHPLLPQSLASLTLVRFLCSFAVLLVPTTLMGATLPLVIKSSLLRTTGLGERVGLLYGVNTTGAIVGTSLAGFVLLGSVGISTSFWLAAALNLLVGTTAVLVSTAIERTPPRKGQAVRAGSSPVGNPTPRRQGRPPPRPACPGAPAGSCCSCSPCRGSPRWRWR
jgi:spermidine synthase